MVTEVIQTKDGQIGFHENGKKSNRSEYYYLSTDAKPHDHVENADILYEMDTQKVYLYDEANKAWIEQ
jgi:hypothetical protein